MLLTNSNVNAIIPHVWLTLSSNLPRRTLGIRPLLAPPELQPPRHSDLPTFHLAIFFRIRTYEKTVRNSFRIRTYKTRHLKSFRIRTYKKRPGGWAPNLRRTARTSLRQLSRCGIFRLEERTVRRKRKRAR